MAYPNHSDRAQEPDLSAPFAVLLEDALRRLDRVEHQLREASYLYSGAIEDRSYRAFIEAIRLAVQGMRQVVVQREQAFAEGRHSAVRRSAYSALGADATSIEEQLEAHLPELSVERPQELQVFAVPFTRLAKSLVKNVELLFFAWPYDGYEAQVYSSDNLDQLDGRLAENLERVFGGDVKFIKLWHPATRERDIFHHAVFAHELAHAAIQQEVPEERLSATDVPPQGEALPTYETVATDAVARPALLQEDDEDRLLMWFREVACDIVAMRIMGPAFTVAFCDVTSQNRTLEPTESTGEHPPAAIRFRFLREELERFGFAEGSDELGALLFRYTAAFPHHEDSAEIPGAEEWLNRAVEKFREYVPHLLNPAGVEYFPEVLQRDLGAVVDLASRDVPPAERLVAVEDTPAYEPAPSADEWSRPLDWRSILNGVLVWHLSKDGFPTLLEPLADDPQAHGAAAERKRERAKQRSLAARLAFAGIELCEFHTRALHLRDQYRDLHLPEELMEPATP